MPVSSVIAEQEDWKGTVSGEAVPLDLDSERMTGRPVIRLAEEPDAEPWLLMGGAILFCGLALALAATWEGRHQ